MIRFFSEKSASLWEQGLSLNCEGSSKMLRQSTPQVRIMFVKTKSGICFWGVASLSGFCCVFFNDICCRLLLKYLVLCAANTLDGPTWYFKI